MSRNVLVQVKVWQSVGGVSQCMLSLVELSLSSRVLGETKALGTVFGCSTGHLTIQANAMRGGEFCNWTIRTIIRLLQVDEEVFKSVTHNI